MAFADQPRIIGLALAEGWRRFCRRAFSAGSGRLRFGGPAPERLVIAPPDLNTADPTVAQDIYAGIFFLAGRSVDTAGKSPFRIPPPTPAWEGELHSFRWLCHLEAAGGTLSANNAQALVRDWLAANPRPRKTAAWRPDVAAERLIAWLSHSVLVLENADIGLYRQYLKSIGQHIRHLRRVAGDAPAGMPRLGARVALAYAAVCVAGNASAPKSAYRHLDNELAHQILPDGGHVSRNPAVLPEILAWLLPLRQSFAKLGIAPSPELVSAIDRIMPAIRFYRLGDGGFARFNGCSTTPRDLVATVLRYDDAHGEPYGEAAYSGYQRMVLGQAVVVIDTGMPPPGEMSSQAHAGCLSFEMSSGRSPIVVNCGAPALGEHDSVSAARSTAAHSTAVINDTSSCRFKLEGVIGRYLDQRIIAGPQKVVVQRQDDEETRTVWASHDGYARAFDIVHERSLRLCEQGTLLVGRDRFSGASGKPPRHATRDKVVIRFHLHPSVDSEPLGDGHSLLLWTGEGECWKFTSPQLAPVLEESIFFAAAGGARRTTQIVLQAKAAEHPEIDWSLERQ